MKKLRPVLILLVVIAIGGCAAITGLFGPGKNNVLDWVADFVEGTRITYQERVSSSDPDFGLDGVTYTYPIEIVDIDPRETKTEIQVLFDGDDGYLIADDARGQLVQSANDFIDDADMILLEIPIEVGSTWLGPLNSYVLEWLGIFGGIENTRFTIEDVKASRDAGTETASDVVVIHVTFPDGFWAEGTVPTTAELYYSPTFGWLGDRYVLSEDGETYTFETVVTDVDRP